MNMFIHFLYCACLCLSTILNQTELVMRIRLLLLKLTSINHIGYQMFLLILLVHICVLLCLSPLTCYSPPPQFSLPPTQRVELNKIQHDTKEINIYHINENTNKQYSGVKYRSRDNISLSCIVVCYYFHTTSQQINAHIYTCNTRNCISAISLITINSNILIS